jgi:hypothetical protein
VSGATRLGLLGLRVVATVAGWVFGRPLWLFPVRLVVLAGAMVLAARAVGA